MTTEYSEERKQATSLAGIISCLPQVKDRYQGGRYLAGPKALCTGSAESWFPPPKVKDWYTSLPGLLAKTVCQSCPIRGECLEDAMLFEHGVPDKWRHGIWGALDPDERAELARARKAEASAA